ncbi:MAG: threonine ammonia-lyase, biosynthetic [Pigmentiphaga sp.]|nr:threonine ammonia-lyase, biosynthetic [Pigmentiphaga sp.]
MSSDYLKRVLNAKVYDVAIESALDFAPIISRKIGNQVYLKREDTQPVFSFKIRGAYNKMAHLSQEALGHGVIAASAGNHAQGVALSARRMGCRAVIVMPTTTPKLKIDAVKAFGAEVVLAGDSYSDAYDYAKALEAKEHLTFVHPFDDPDVIAGQGTVAMEILRQHTGPIDAIFVPIGGGGLISGVATYVKALRPSIKVIGVQTEDSDAMAQSIQQAHRVTLKDVGLFSDGTAVKLVGEETFRLSQEFVDDVISVNTDAICAAIKDTFEETRSILEPAGALSLAGAKKYLADQDWTDKTVVAIASGANMNFDRLRFVAERAEVGEAREAVFAVTMPEERGSFKRFCELVGTRNVTEFNYRMQSTEKAHVFVGIQITPGESTTVADNFRHHGFGVLDLTQDELAKAHLRHMIGGRSDEAVNERLFRFEFPERPGALMRFLSCMPPDWNISLFHYRNQGSDYGNILVGLQVPPSDRDDFSQFLQKVGYRYWDESNNPAYTLFLR